MGRQLHASGEAESNSGRTRICATCRTSYVGVEVRTAISLAPASTTVSLTAQVLVVKQMQQFPRRESARGIMPAYWDK